MSSLEPPPRHVPPSTDDATATAPRIVNGLTVRSPKKVNLWLLGLPLLPNFAALIVLPGLGMHRLLRYLNTQKKKNDRM